MDGGNSERLVKRLSSAGVASRRACFEMIRSGEVKVNGAVVLEPSAWVEPGDAISCKDAAVEAVGKRVRVMLYKPMGFVCTSSDPHAERTVMELVRIPKARLFTVGRLDKDTEGLILLTDDGDFCAKVSHPRSGIRKSYLVRISGHPPRDTVERLIAGIEDAGELLRAERARQLDEDVFALSLGEGRNREVRRMFRTMGCRVSDLRRIGIGALGLGELAAGQWRHMSESDAAASQIPGVDMVDDVD